MPHCVAVAARALGAGAPLPEPVVAAATPLSSAPPPGARARASVSTQASAIAVPVTARVAAGFEKASARRRMELVGRSVQALGFEVGRLAKAGKADQSLLVHRRARL